MTESSTFFIWVVAAIFYYNLIYQDMTQITYFKNSEWSSGAFLKLIYTHFCFFQLSILKNFNNTEN